MFIKVWRTDTSVSARSARKKTLGLGECQESVRSVTKTSFRGKLRLNVAVALPALEPVTMKGFAKLLREAKKAMVGKATALGTQAFTVGSKNTSEDQAIASFVKQPKLKNTSGQISQASINEICLTGRGCVASAIMPSITYRLNERTQ